MRLLLLIVCIFASSFAYAQIVKRHSTTTHTHNVDLASSYLGISTGADPDTDGVRIGPGVCFECVDCGSRALIDANVKGATAGTGYSVIQKK